MPDDALLDLPFDQYQRYGALALAADRLRARLGRPLTILDCGDWTGLAERFCPGDRAVWLDPTGQGSGRYVQADGAHLPFADGQFDLAACLDTLEHVPPPDRPAVVAELRRVAHYVVVLAAPRDDDGAPSVERALYDYVWDVLGGEHQQLAEHLARGLPRADEMRAWLAAPGWRCADTPSGLLDDWRTMMLTKHLLWRTPDGAALQRSFDRRYNERHGVVDPAVPAYRHILFAGRAEIADIPETVIGSLPAPRHTPDASDTEAALSLLLAAHARRAGAALDAHAAACGDPDALYLASRALNRAVADLSAGLDRARADLAAAESLIVAYRAGRLMRLLAAVADFRRRLLAAIPPRSAGG